MTARANADPAHLAAKRARLAEAHVAALVGLADQIAAARGLARGDVPYPDPDSAGVDARALFLLSTPGPKAKAGEGSGLLSIENNDPTAARCYRTLQAAGLPYSRCVSWNAVPWPTAGRTPTTGEMTAARPWLARLLDLLPELRAVVLLGRVAQDCWRRAAPPLPAGVTVLEAPHPSNLGMNQPGAPERLAEAVRRTAEVVRDG